MKRHWIMIVLVILMLVGCSRELNVIANDDIVIEYGDDLSDDVVIAQGSDEISIKDIQGFDNMAVGKQTVTITFTDGEIDKEIDVYLEVKDTKGPEIKIKEDKIEIEEGNDIDLIANVSCRDEVDGDIKYHEEKITKDGFNIDLTDFDKDIPGTYEIKVIAYDRNGNQDEGSFEVTVLEKPEPIIETPIKETTKAPEQAPTPSLEPVVSDSPIVKAALAEVGGHNNCSGLAEIAINAVGKSAWTTDRIDVDGGYYTMSKLSPENFVELGQSINISDMRPGDILYYADGGAGVSHVAVYIGNDEAVHGGWMGDNIVVETINIGSGVTGVYRFD